MPSAEGMHSSPVINQEITVINTAMPPALTQGHLCPDCRGTGADRAKTIAARQRGDCDSSAYIRCWACNGNGLDPAAYFHFSG